MYTKFAKFARLYFLQLQHFTTKLRNFSKRGMLFQAMVIFLPISIFFKILSERGKVHSVIIRFVSDFSTTPDKHC